LMMSGVSADVVADKIVSQALGKYGVLDVPAPVEVTQDVEVTPKKRRPPRVLRPRHNIFSPPVVNTAVLSTDKLRTHMRELAEGAMQKCEAVELVMNQKDVGHLIDAFATDIANMFDAAHMTYATSAAPLRVREFVASMMREHVAVSFEGKRKRVRF